MNDQSYLVQIYGFHSGIVPASIRLAYARKMLALRKRYSWVHLEQRPVLTRNYL